MKNLVTASLSSLTLLCSLSSLANNVDLASGYVNTAEVFEYGRKVKNVRLQLTDAGYVLQNCSETQVNYFVQPNEPHYLYGETHCMFYIPRPAGSFSFQTDYAELKMQSHYHQQNFLYHEGDVNVSYFTVY